METICRDYAPKGVKFYYIYKALAHPETNGYVTPFTLEERLMHVKEAERTLGSEFTWLCDAMSNDIKHTLGNAPNSEFVVSPDGNVARRRAWSDPAQLRKDLEELIGMVENPTKVFDLELKTAQSPDVAAKGVVPRIAVPGLRDEAGRSGAGQRAEGRRMESPPRHVRRQIEGEDGRSGYRSGFEVPGRTHDLQICVAFLH